MHLDLFRTLNKLCIAIHPPLTGSVPFPIGIGKAKTLPASAVRQVRLRKAGQAVLNKLRFTNLYRYLLKNDNKKRSGTPALLRLVRQGFCGPLCPQTVTQTPLFVQQRFLTLLHTAHNQTTGAKSKYYHS